MRTLLQRSALEEAQHRCRHTRCACTDRFLCWWQHQLTRLNDTGTGGVFVPTTGRILDTMNNIGGYSTPMPAKTWRTVKVTGLAGVPDDGTVGAVSMVATVADITTAGQLFGRPDADTKYTLMGIYGGEQQQNTSFSSVLAVGADGTFQVYAETSARLIRTCRAP